MRTRWLILRLVRALGSLLVLSALTFALADLAPGDPFGELRLDSRMSPETVTTLRARYGLDGSLVERYARWLASIGRGEWGWSFSHQQPVGRLLWPRVRNTFLLALAAITFAWAFALPIGIVSAARPNGWIDRTGFVVTSLVIAIPELLVGLAAITLAVRTGWFPAGGMHSTVASGTGVASRVLDVLWHLVLPAGVIGLGTVPAIVRHVRAAMLESLASPFVRAARGCGLSPRRILIHHALPAAANPMIALAGLSIAGLLSTSFVVEIIFAWPGLGSLLLDAIFARDLHVVVAGVVLSFGLAVAGNLVAELAMRAVDPRVRSRRSE